MSPRRGDRPPKETDQEEDVNDDHNPFGQGPREVKQEEHGYETSWKGSSSGREPLKDRHDSSQSSEAMDRGTELPDRSRSGGSEH